MIHQRLSILGQARRAPASLEKRGADNAFQLADGVADGAGGQIQLGGGAAEGSRARRRFKDAKVGQGQVAGHDSVEQDSPSVVNNAFYLGLKK